MVRKSRSLPKVIPYIWDAVLKKFKAWDGILTGNGAQSEVTVTQRGYLTRYDDAGSGITYIGKAAPGSSSANAVWQISKLDESTSPDFTLTWADGNDSFDNIWNNRAILTYS